MIKFRSTFMRMPALSLGLFGCILLAGLQNVAGQNRQTFDSRIRPFLSKNCTGCHNAKLNTANLNLDSFADEASAAKKPELWDKVRDKLVTGKMPPPPAPAPAKEDVAAVTNWIEGVLKSSGYASDNPGRVVARRLNRVEYNNTIRDLLAVPVRPADEFPVDDSGYGFDNVGDVLTVSPMLMEKYLAAAEKVSHLAIYGSALPDKPTRLIRLLNRRSPDVNDVANSLYGVALPYSMRGAMYGTWVFPADAEYEFRLRIANFRGGDVVVNSNNGPGRGGGRGAPGQPSAGAGGAARSCRSGLPPEEEDAERARRTRSSHARTASRARRSGPESSATAQADPYGRRHACHHGCCGSALLEAMARSVPVICLDWAGPGEMVDANSGVKIPVLNPGETVWHLPKRSATCSRSGAARGHRGRGADPGGIAVSLAVEKRTAGGHLQPTDRRLMNPRGEFLQALFRILEQRDVGFCILRNTKMSIPTRSQTWIWWSSPIRCSRSKDVWRKPPRAPTIAWF